MKKCIALILFLLTSSTLFAQPVEFVDSVDMSPWNDRVAVFTDGRVKSFETFARSYMPYIMGSQKYQAQEATFTYFDMLIRPERYEGKDIVFIKHKGLRGAIIAEVDTSNPVVQARMDLFMSGGLVSREILQEETVRTLLNRLRQDVRRFATPVEKIEGAISASNPQMMWNALQIIPPESGQFNLPWNIMGPTTNADILSAWEKLIVSWQNEDVATVNTQLKTLSVLLPALANDSEIYPPSSKLKMESIYFRMGNFTSIWLVYLVSIVLLLMAFIYRFKRVGRLGIAIFVLAVLLNTLTVIWRWYVSGRYPNTNMFEAVTTAACMGGLFGILMEIFVRRTAMKYVFSLGAAIAAMVALLAVRLYPLELNPHISNKMPVLHDVWLYIHVNFVIFSYCLIFVASVSASIYLIRRLILKLNHKDGKNDYARAGGVASLLEVRPGNKSSLSNNMGSVLDGATMVLVELAFILLWTGISMGAIWADHSWGRPWGWDPKEVFALNTFIIFVVLIHTRMKVKDKGFWTAWLALIGCAVMLFNWIIINFTISGLHSYA